MGSEPSELKTEQSVFITLGHKERQRYSLEFNLFLVGWGVKLKGEIKIKY